MSAPPPKSEHEPVSLFEAILCRPRTSILAAEYGIAFVKKPYIVEQRVLQKWSFDRYS